MTIQKVRQPRPLASEPSHRTPQTPYLNAHEAAVYLRYKNAASLRKAIPIAGIPVRYCGSKLLFHRDELDRWLAGEARVALLSEARRGAR